MAHLSFRFPRIVIEFCTACKWNLRAAYFAQELLQTFGTDLGEIAVQPTTGGIFKVHLYHEEPGTAEDEEATFQEYLLWDRKAEGGFPETKELKRRVRNIIDPTRDLGHVDGKKSTPSEPHTQTPEPQSIPANPHSYASNPPIPRAINRLQSLSVESHPSEERKFTPMDVDVNSRPTSSKGEAIIGEGQILNSRGKIVITGDAEGGGYCIPGEDCG